MRKGLILLLLTLLGATIFVGLRNRKENSQAPQTADLAPPAVSAAEPSSTPNAEPSSRPWPHASGDLKPDPEALYGTLANGLRYIILPHAEPPQRVSLRLHVDAGSLMEDDDQQGMAHFLEHMVFNGSENFTPDELIPQMQRLGISFGAHANAYTSFDETVYMLDLPNTKDKTLDLGFTVMRDFADGALLKSEEIDKERGVILSEKRSRDSVGRRLMEQQFEALMPDFRVTKRFPIGKEEQIKTVPRQRFLDFYQGYYTPKRSTIIVVGDITADAAKQRIEKTFTSMEEPENALSDPEMGSLRDIKTLETQVYADPEVAEDELELIMISRYLPLPDTSENRLAKLPLQIAHAMMNQRLNELAKKEGSVIKSGRVGKYNWFNEIEFGSYGVTPIEGQWKAAIGVLEQELRRVLEHGFTQSEFDFIKRTTLKSYEQATKQASTRQSAQLASSLVRAINDEKTFLHPKDLQDLMAKGFTDLTPEQCFEAFSKFWNDPGKVLSLTTKKKNADLTNTITSLYQQSQKVAVAAPIEKKALEFAYQDFGPAGTIIAETDHPELGIKQLTLSNEVRVNFKQTDFEKNRVSILARFGPGQLSQPEHSPGLQMVASTLINAGGLGAHSVEDLKQILAGKIVHSSFGIQEGNFQLNGSTTQEDLLSQLQLMTAQLQDPGYRPEALRSFKKSIPSYYEELKYSMNGPMAEMRSWLRGEDPRFEVPARAALEAYTEQDVQDWLSPLLKMAPLEISIIGDISWEELSPLLLQTFGAIPKREPLNQGTTGTLTPPEKGSAKTFTYQSKIENAAAVVLWKTTGLTDNISEVRRLNVLANILDDRMRKIIREQLGASYSPYSGSQASDAFTNYGMLTALSQGKPSDVPVVSDIIVKLGQELAEKGATQDELERALKPTLSNLQSTLRKNGYWLNTVMAQSQQNPQRLEWAKERETDYTAITLEEINALAQKYLQKEAAYQVQLLPRPLEQPAKK